MNIMSFFSWDSVGIPVERIFEIDETVIEQLYVKGNETERFNVFFYLQREFFALKNNNHKKELAHISYLISYYLFIALTPPHSCELALEYAKTAFEVDRSVKYRKWIEFVKKGN